MADSARSSHFNFYNVPLDDFAKTGNVRALDLFLETIPEDYDEKEPDDLYDDSEFEEYMYNSLFYRLRRALEIAIHNNQLPVVDRLLKFGSRFDIKANAFMEEVIMSGHLPVVDYFFNLEEIDPNLHL